MITALDFPADKLDDRECEFVGAIKDHGWFATRVFDAEGKLPEFSYSTGLWLRHGFPELILFGLPRKASYDILSEIVREAESSVKLPMGVRLNHVFGNADAFLMPVARRYYEEHLGWSRWFYGGDDFPCAHLIWPDAAGLFPWEPGFGEDMSFDQPDLTERGWPAELAN
ncbi:MAG: hypothetical protein QOJ91_1685 [Sphingomonadales bacterium]|nr:hypothetical protein [Sphingomonadales bacterium]